MAGVGGGGRRTGFVRVSSRVGRAENSAPGRSPARRLTRVNIVERLGKLTARLLDRTPAASAATHDEAAEAAVSRESTTAPAEPAVADVSGTPPRSGPVQEPVDLRTVTAARDPRAWIALDLDIRAGLRRSERPWDATSTPEPLDPGPTGPEALAIALCHADGRTRQAAVQRAAEVPALMPLIAVRCTDWAAPVRTQALTLLRTALPTLPADAFCDVALVEQQLRDGEREFLARCLAAPERRVQRLAAGIAVRRGLFTAVEHARFAATGTDVAVQDQFAQAAALALPGEDTETVLALLLGCRQPRVRATGVTALNRLGLPARAEPFLIDRSPVVRACARWVLRQHGGDPLPRYRELCADPDRLERTTAVAATGLGECGDRADAALLLPLLAHPLPQVRAQAVGGLRSLDVTPVDEMLPLVDDPAAVVVRAATEALLPSAYLLTEPWFAVRAAEGVPGATRVAATRLRQAKGRHSAPYHQRSTP